MKNKKDIKKNNKRFTYDSLEGISLVKKRVKKDPDNKDNGNKLKKGFEQWL